jgi:hypothetical protein
MAVDPFGDAALYALTYDSVANETLSSTVGTDGQIISATLSMVGRQGVTDKNHLKGAVPSALRKLQQKAELIKSFFMLPETQYAQDLGPDNR